MLCISPPSFCSISGPSLERSILPPSFLSSTVRVARLSEGAKFVAGVLATLSKPAEVWRGSGMTFGDLGDSKEVEDLFKTSVSPAVLFSDLI